MKKKEKIRYESPHIDIEEVLLEQMIAGSISVSTSDNVKEQWGDGGYLNTKDGSGGSLNSGTNNPSVDGNYDIKW